MDLGRRLRQLRIRAGFTQRSLADAIDVHYTAISHVEQGQRKPSLELLQKWADACGAALTLATPSEATLLTLLLVDGVDPDLLVRLARLLPDLSRDNQETLRVLLGVWEKSAISQVISPTGDTGQRKIS